MPVFFLLCELLVLFLAKKNHYLKCQSDSMDNTYVANTFGISDSIAKSEF